MLNKKACRKYADPGWTIPPGHGLLHAKQVQYIVRTAVRIIDHHRTLVLYVYPCEQPDRPRWVVFQRKDDFITLEHKETGATSWRQSLFYYLRNGWNFVSACAFYSQADQDRVIRYLRSGMDDGFAALLQVQNTLRDLRLEKRQKQRERDIKARMESLPALPRGLKGWIDREVMPAYFFYDYQKGRKKRTGVCTSCGQESTLTGVKHNAQGTCPHCGRSVTMKARGRRGRLMDRDTVQVVQKVSDTELVLRIVKVYYSYPDDVPRKSVYESARLFLCPDADGKIALEAYYDSYRHGGLTSWKKGFRPVFSHWCYNFEEDLRGHVYSGNLPKALYGTPWQHCPIQSFCGQFPSPMELSPVLAAHWKYPQFEYLVKAGFYQLAHTIAYHGDLQSILNRDEKRMHRFLGVAAEDVPFLQKLNIDLQALQIFQTYRGRKDRRELLQWQLSQQVTRDTLPLVEHMTAHKLMRYAEVQKPHYHTMQALVTEYRDYIEMCRQEGYDLSNDFVLFPKDLRRAHDTLASQIKQKADARMRQDFIDAYAQCAGQLDFAWKDMQIRCPSVPEDVIAEGHTLHHCVGSYVSRAAKGDCLILFLRRRETPDEPFYTIELQGDKVVQVRGMRNADPTPEVDAFIRQWEQKVLSPLALPAAG